jgi:hypothetical protein
MEVLLLTTLFSVVFAVFFLALFIRDRQNRPFGGIEREALLPLDDDPATPPIPGEPVENLKDLEKNKAPGSSVEKTSV